MKRKPPRGLPKGRAFSHKSPLPSRRSWGPFGLRVFHSDSHLVPLPVGHRFPMRKYAVLRAALLKQAVLAPGELIPAEPVALEALARVHTPRWLEAVLGGHLSEAEVRRLGFPWTEALVLRSRAAVGGTCAAACAALEEGFAGNLAGGTHHAFADHGEGFCVFNDIAVSIRALQAQGRIVRAAVVDLDVHQGNGTAAVFAEDASVFTFSMHGEHTFPFRKQRSSLDVGLPDGTTDAVYLDALYRNLPHVLDAARPELVYYQAGVDPLAEDTLGRLALTHAGLEARDRFVFETVRRRNVPLVVTLGGGYARPLESSVAAHVGTYRAARAVFEG
jgi:acetoin utilization deacetylase AcuC-like enzyme